MVDTSLSLIHSFCLSVYSSLYLFLSLTHSVSLPASFFSLTVSLLIYLNKEGWILFLIKVYQSNIKVFRYTEHNHDIRGVQLSLFT